MTETRDPNNKIVILFVWLALCHLALSFINIKNPFELLGIATVRCLLHH